MAIDDSKTFAYQFSSPAAIAEALCAGRCPPDCAFDAFLPEDLASLSADQWTPLEVVLLAARWLKEQGVRRVVDIGAGPGKFCVAAALAGGFDVVGVEQNSRFVAVARALARLFDVQSRVGIVHGSLGETLLPPADAYYIYNPFAQCLSAPCADLASDGLPDYERYRRDVMLAQDTFRHAPQGTIVITYNGFGGLMPASYLACRVNRELPCVLRMWQKSEAWDDAGFSSVDAD